MSDAGSSSGRTPGLGLGNEGSNPSPAIERWLWISTKGFTVTVRVERGRIVEGPPLVRRFLGQPEQNLMRWVQRQPGCLIYTYESKGEGDEHHVRRTED